MPLILLNGDLNCDLIDSIEPPEEEDNWDSDAVDPEIENQLYSMIHHHFEAENEDNGSRVTVALPENEVRPEPTEGTLERKSPQKATVYANGLKEMLLPSKGVPVPVVSAKEKERERRGKKRKTPEVNDLRQRQVPKKEDIITILSDSESGCESKSMSISSSTRRKGAPHLSSNSFGALVTVTSGHVSDEGLCDSDSSVVCLSPSVSESDSDSDSGTSSSTSYSDSEEKDDELQSVIDKRLSGVSSLKLSNVKGSNEGISNLCLSHEMKASFHSTDDEEEGQVFKRPSKWKHHSSSFSSPGASESPSTSSASSTFQPNQCRDGNKLRPNSSELSLKLLDKCSPNKRGFKRLKLDPGEDPGMWKVDFEDLRLNSSFNPRYFRKKQHCDHCKDYTDHATRFCPRPRQSVCVLCSTPGHLSDRCSEQICSKCCCVGHSAEHCNVNVNSLSCEGCSLTGHRAHDCPNHWRKFHVTTSLESLHVGEKNSRPSIRKNKRQFCSNCSNRGHYGFECLGLERNRNYLPTSPFLTSTEKMFNKQMDGKADVAAYETPAKGKEKKGRKRKLMSEYEEKSERKRLGQKRKRLESMRKAKRLESGRDMSYNEEVNLHFDNYHLSVAESSQKRKKSKKKRKKPQSQPKSKPKKTTDGKGRKHDRLDTFHPKHEKGGQKGSRKSKHPLNRTI